jgi:cell division protein FtsB
MPEGPLWQHTARNNPQICPPAGDLPLRPSLVRDSLRVVAGGKRSIGLIRRAAAPALALIVVGNFAGYAIAGPNGLLAWGGYHRDLEERKAELAELEAERERLRHRSALLDPKKADPDIADELVRKELGLVRPDEVIIPLD